MTNLISIYPKTANIVQSKQTEVNAQTQPKILDKKDESAVLNNYLANQAQINAPLVKNVQSTQAASNVAYKNDLKTLFQNNQAKILAIIPRTFNAKDKNGDDAIELNLGEESGNFLNAIDRLDEVKANGFNTLHILPIHPTGKQKAMGTAGSLYAASDLLAIDPVLDDKNDPRPVKEEFKQFIKECHKRGIRVMLDLPSCASVDLFNERPELMAIEKDGLAKVPQGWNDIRMFQPWADEGKRTLNPHLLDLHKQYVDMCVDLGIDGIRTDVARAKPIEFWDEIIKYSHSKDPQFAWLAESYTYEDASPMANMPYDRPEDCFKAGFDSYYGQYHIFHEWPKAKNFTDYVEQNIELSQKFPKGKSTIGSFATHDDISPMTHGGAEYCNLTSGLQATLPMLNPYVVDGFQTGDDYVYKYEGKTSDFTMTDNHEMTVHHGLIDIFNLSRKPGGKHPEIADFLTKSFEMRDKYVDVIGKGSFIELKKEKDADDQIIAYARHLNGKTLLVIANRNVDRPVVGIVDVPTLKANQELKNLLPSYGQHSEIQADDNKVRVNLGPARIHVFEIETPDIEKHSEKVFKQNL